jgi:hypothetical protein
VRAFAAFWMKEDLRFEQPDIQFLVSAGEQRMLSLRAMRALQNDVLVYASGERRGTDNSVSSLQLAYSTSERAQDVLSASLRAPIIRVSEVGQVRCKAPCVRVAQSRHLTDVGDARLDRLELNISFPLRSDEHITGVSVFLPTKVRLHSTVKMDTSGLVALSHTAGVPGSQVLFVGDIALHMRMQLREYSGGGRVLSHYQRRCAAAGTRYVDPMANVPVIDLDSVTDASDLAPSTLLIKNLARNVSLSALVPTPLWVPLGGRPLGQPSQLGNALGGFSQLAEPPTFDISIHLRIPPQPIW